MKYQVISKDYNGTTVILKTSEDLESSIDFIKKEVTNANFENALTTTDKFKTIESFFPLAISKSGKEVKNIVYAGKFTNGEHKVYAIKPDKETELRSASGINFMFYIGKNEDKDFYLENEKNVLVNSFDDPSLNEKTQYYIKVIK